MKKVIEYKPNIVCYDIETTSFETDNGKHSLVYSHCVMVDRVNRIFRYRHEFVNYMKNLIKELNVTPYSRLVVYVHNLSFEFQYLKHMFEFINDQVVTVGGVNGVIKAPTIDGLEFRCSYKLTNQPLAKLGEAVGFEKLTGDLDYSLIRHEDTELDEKEIGYILRDTEIMDVYLRKALSEDNFETIPMTSTGFVRRGFRSIIENDKRYHDLIDSLKLKPAEFLLALKSFAGGYVHANMYFANCLLYGVKSADLGSSYPASMVSRKYPMSAGVPLDVGITLEELSTYESNDLLFIADVVFKGVKCKYQMPPLSASKCTGVVKPVIDNGRILQADELTTTLDSVSLFEMLKTYDVDEVEIISGYKYKAGYLPKVFVEYILKLYGDKTKYKDVAGKEDIYALSKALLNSLYGMIVTNPLKDIYEYDPVTKDFVKRTRTDKEIKKDLQSYNKTRPNLQSGRFLYYPWGVFVTAYSRSVLFEALREMEDNGVNVYYCDTDSVYCDDNDTMERVIDSMNDKIMSRTIEALDYLGIDIMDAMPESPSGERYFLGLWEVEKRLDEFKAIGAKRYGYRCGDKYVLTASGINKKKGSEWLANNGVDALSEEIKLSADECGSNLVSHHLTQYVGPLTDHNGVTKIVEVYKNEGVHMEPAGRELKMGVDHLELINKIQGITKRTR